MNIMTGAPCPIWLKKNIPTLPTLTLSIRQLQCYLPTLEVALKPTSDILHPTSDTS